MIWLMIINMAISPKNPDKQRKVSYRDVQLVPSDALTDGFLNIQAVNDDALGPARLHNAGDLLGRLLRRQNAD